MGTGEDSFIMPEEYVPFDTIELESFRYAISKAISNKLAMEADIRFLQDYFVDQTVMTIVQTIYGKQILEYHDKYPLDWWQAFKERWYPTWAKEKWPVKYKYIDYDVRELLPTINIPRHPSHIVTKLDILGL
jgi:hypothetical protein